MNTVSTFDTCPCLPNKPAAVWSVCKAARQPPEQHDHETKAVHDANETKPTPPAVTQVCKSPDTILSNATIKKLMGAKCDGVIGQLTEVGGLSPYLGFKVGL